MLHRELTQRRIQLLILWIILAIIIIGGITVGLHWVLGERPLNYTGVRAWLDTVYSITILGFVIFGASGTGWIIVDRIGLPYSNQLEAALIALAIGFGVVAYGVLMIGFAGLLMPLSLLVWLGLVSVIGAIKWKISMTDFGVLKEFRTFLRKPDFFKKLLLFIGLILFFLTLFQALTPPWDYDSQLYHLEVPRRFLADGEIAPQPDHWLTYFPLTVQMLFTLGLGLGSDVFAKLIHLTFAVMLFLSTYAFGKRFLGTFATWLAAGVLIGIPIFPIWSSWAYVDMGWAVFIFLSTYSVIVWGETRSKKWLFTSGILMGFGLGTKYTSFGAAVSIGLLVMLLSQERGWRAILANAAIFGGVAFIVSSPWYLKNLFWTYNPIYPLFQGASNWSPYRLEIWMSFVRGFGTGDTFWDFLLLPLNIYRRPERFSTWLIEIDKPSFLFPLIVLYPWTRRNRQLDRLLFLSFIQFVIWAFGSQVNRYLLPIFPYLSLLTGYIIAHYAIRLQIGKLGFVLSRGLVLGMVAVTLIINIGIFLRIAPLDVIIGTESKNAFLRRNVKDYSAIEFIKSKLSEEDLVLMMWDGKGYYCKESCLPDLDHSQWTDMTMQSQYNVMSLANVLNNKGVTHLLLTFPDAYYVLSHDPKGFHTDALIFFLDKFRSSCTREIYSDESTSIYELTCRSETDSITDVTQLIVG